MIKKQNYLKHAIVLFLLCCSCSRVGHGLPMRT